MVTAMGMRTSTTGHNNALLYGNTLLKQRMNNMLYVNIVRKKYLEVERVIACITKWTSIKHFKSDHRDPYKKFCDDKELAEVQHMSNKDQGLKQLTTEGVNDKTQQWGIHDARSECVHRKLGEMVTIDCQPYSIVEDIGFNRLVMTLEPQHHLPSWKVFLTENIPRITQCWILL